MRNLTLTNYSDGRRTEDETLIYFNKDKSQPALRCDYKLSVLGSQFPLHIFKVLNFIPERMIG